MTKYVQDLIPDIERETDLTDRTLQRKNGLGLQLREAYVRAQKTRVENLQQTRP